MHSLRSAVPLALTLFSEGWVSRNCKGLGLCMKGTVYRMVLRNPVFRGHVHSHITLTPYNSHIPNPFAGFGLGELQCPVTSENWISRPCGSWSACI